MTELNNLRIVGNLFINTLNLFTTFCVKNIWSDVLVERENSKSVSVWKWEVGFSEERSGKLGVGSRRLKELQEFKREQRGTEWRQTGVKQKVRNNTIPYTPWEPTTTIFLSNLKFTSRGKSSGKSRESLTSESVARKSMQFFPDGEWRYFGFLRKLLMENHENLRQVKVWLESRCNFYLQWILDL